jgi:RimJ/RimL family protein N-acetyltransferase
VSARIPAGTISLRAARAEDCIKVWKWRNDGDTRRASFDSAEIPWSVHERWFAETLKRSDRKLYIVVAKGLSEGVVRLDLVGAEAAVSIHLAPEWRGKGVGSVALRRVGVIAFRELKLRRLVASVKEDNTASISAFKKARFMETKREGGVITLQKRRGG